MDRLTGVTPHAVSVAWTADDSDPDDRSMSTSDGEYVVRTARAGESLRRIGITGWTVAVLSYQRPRCYGHVLHKERLSEADAARARLVDLARVLEARWRP